MLATRPTLRLGLSAWMILTVACGTGSGPVVVEPAEDGAGCVKDTCGDTAGENKKADHGGLPHNHLLVTLLHALGVGGDHFGSPDIPVGNLDIPLLG